MENDKAIAQNKKSIFISTANTLQANHELLNIIQSAKKMTDGTIALTEQDWENIRKCLENGADPNLKSADCSQAPLVYLAAAYDRKELFEYLLQLGADINAHDGEGWTPLHIFVFKFHKNTDLTISYLLQEGANPNAINKGKETPFTYAAQRNHLDFIQSLIQHRANVNHYDSITTPLGWALKTSSSDNLKTIGILCKAGASAINIDNYNRTAFHLVQRSKKVIKTLITHINFKNNDAKLTIKTALLVFNRLNYPLKSESQKNSTKFPIIPREIQIFILSKLLSPNFFHKGLYKQCERKIYQQLSFEFVNEHVQHLKKILQMKNNSYFKATAEKTKLLNGSKLQEDLDIFNETYPNITLISEDNLVRKIFENHYS